MLGRSDRRSRGLLALVAVFVVGMFVAPSALAVDFLQPGTSPEPLTLASAPAGTAVGDLDGDNDQDIAVSAALGVTATVLLNDGTGNFTESTSIATNAATADVAIGKFDADSFPDLVFLYPQTGAGSAGNPGLVAIFKGNGTGGFTLTSAAAIAGTPVRSTALAVGDFNGNGTDDVAITGQNNAVSTDTTATGRIFIQMTTGTGTFVTPSPATAPAAQQYTTQLAATDVAVGNFDGGAPDLVSSNAGSGTISFLHGTGAGPNFFSPPVHTSVLVASVFTPYYLDVGDMNGDGNQDVVASGLNSAPALARVIRGDGAGAFPAAGQTSVPLAVGTTNGVAPQRIVATDLSGDGAKDIAAVDLQRSAGDPVPAVSYAINSGDGTSFAIGAGSPEVGIGAANTFGWGIASGDFDNNGLNDLAANALFSTNIAILLNQKADVSIVKTDLADSVDAGGTVTYTLSAANAGPDTATAVRATDVLPAGVTFTSADAGCTEAAGTVTCQFGDLASGASAQKQIVVTTTGSVTGTDALSNTATVATNSTDLVPGNNSSTQTTTVNAVADLSVTKAGPPGPVNAGEDVTYTLTAANAGPNDATGVETTDVLPAGLTFKSAGSDAECTETTPGTVTCDFGTLASGANAAHSFVATTGGAASPSVDNSATIAGDQLDLSPADNTSDTVTTPVNASADLSIAKSGPGSVNVGGDLTYTLTASNAGPSGATGVEATDVLPAGLTFKSAGSDAECTEAAGTVTCDFGAIGSGANAAHSFVATAGPTAPANVNNSATVGGDQFDPNAGNDTSNTVATTVTAVADLSVTKSGPAGPVNAGDDITYTLTAANAGPSDAHNVSATDTLPAGLTFKATGSDAECTPAAQVVTCTFGTIASGANASHSFVATTGAAASPSVNNSATIDGDELDTNNANNTSATVTTPVNASADLSIAKSGPGTVDVGGDLTYTLTASNAGPNSATGVEATDVLPAGLTFKSAGSDAECTETTPGTVTCDFGTIASGANAAHSFVATAGPTAPASVDNSATIDGDQFDPSTANDTSSTVSTTVTPVADLSITKSGPASGVEVGDDITYTLSAANAGPSDATSVEATDVLPAGLAFKSDGSDAECTEDTPGTVTCDFGSIASGASSSHSFIATAGVAASPSVDNAATVSGDQTDPEGANDTSNTVTTDVQGGADLQLSKTNTTGSVNVGDTVSFALAVTNDGPLDATGVEVTDALPAGLTFEAAGTDPDCTIAAGTVTCDFATVADGASETKTLVLRTTAAAQPSVNNTASVAGTEDDPDTANNTSSASATVGGSADLAVTLSDTPDPVKIGDNVAYTVTVHNAGPSPATNVNAFDDIPAGATFKAADSSGCIASGTDAVCAFGSVAVGATETAKLVVGTAGMSGPSMVDLVTVDGDEADPNASNDSDSETTTLFTPSVPAPPAGGPAGVKIGKIKAKKGKVRVTFKGSGDFRSFKCQIDKRRPVACASPFMTKLRKVGKHKVTVLVYNSTGALVSTGQKRFKIKRPKKR
jgi:uncharacterized repeat protein (TIGR01451 family)